MKNYSINISKYWGLPSLSLRIKRSSFHVLLTHKMLINAKEHFKWFSIDRDRRINLTTDWDFDITILGIVFQFEKYKWYMYSR